MKQLYVALNSTEAHIISHLLQNDGIDARVQGDYLQGAVGGLPTTGHIRVVVPNEDYERAQHVLKEFQEEAADLYIMLKKNILKRIFTLFP